jgi:hypothetical protein
MPATAADIAAATRPHVLAEWSSATIKARYPTLARNGGTRLIIGYCDSVADAQTLINGQGALIGVERRRFVVRIDGLVWIDPSAGVPCATLHDDEAVASVVCLITRYRIELNDETTLLELLG